MYSFLVNIKSRIISCYCKLSFIICLALIACDGSAQAANDQKTTHHFTKKPHASFLLQILNNPIASPNSIKKDVGIFSSIIVATFISEDLTIITSGLLIRKNKIPMMLAGLACFSGVFIGDLGLFLVGFFIRKFPLAKNLSRWLAQKLPDAKFKNIQTRLQKEGWKLLFLSRFVPGTRLPVYTGAGLVGGQFIPMIIVALFAGLIWTPLLLIASYTFGNEFLRLFEWFSGPGLWSIIIAIISFYCLHKLLFSILLKNGRMKWQIRLKKISMIEFWPPWLFYFPVPFFILILGIRYKGLTTLTAANPGIFAGGFIGESKDDISKHIPKKYMPGYLVFEATSQGSDQVLATIIKKKWKFPLILKPDVSQKGIGLKKVSSRSQLQKILPLLKGKMILQKYSPGPYEAGVFYYRFPGSVSGRILSITQKIFPEIIGDGKASIADLIYAHPRYKLQSDIFIERMKSTKDKIPKKGKIIKLGVAGNHFQGTQFLQANSEITRELTKTFDKISKQVSKNMNGFYFGRYDVRYESQKDFRLGKNIAIIELNGVTSESTDMYDFRLSIISVYKIMWKQLNLAYQVGYLNVQRGYKRTSLLRLLREIILYVKNRPKELVSD